MKLTLTVGIAALVALGGCASTDNLNSWQGHSTQELFSALGEPAQSVHLEDGREVINYQYSYEVYKSGGTGTGTLQRSTGLPGSGPSISLYCDITFRTDTQKNIVSATRQGNFNACNRFLGTIAAAQ